MTPSEVKSDIAARLAGVVPFITVDKILNHQMESLPALAIYIPSTSGQSVSEDEPAFVSVMNVVMDVIVSQTSNYSTVLDAYIEAVKTTLFTDSVFIAQFSEIAGYDVQFQFDDEGEKPTVTAEITLQITTMEIYQPF